MIEQCLLQLSHRLEDLQGAVAEDGLDVVGVSSGDGPEIADAALEIGGAATRKPR